MFTESITTSHLSPPTSHVIQSASLTVCGVDNIHHHLSSSHITGRNLPEKNVSIDFSPRH